MTRFAWFNARWPIGMRSLASRLRAMSFSEEVADGFVLERTRENSVSADYVRKVVSTEERLDPFGKPIPTVDVSYHRTSFTASVSAPGLELIDPPRGNQQFVSRLLEACDFGLTIRALQIDVENWASGVMGLLEIDAVVDAAQYGGIDLGTGTTGRLTVRGKGDIRAATKDFLSQAHVVEKIQLRLGGAHKGSSIVLGNSGTANIVAREVLPLANAVRAALPQGGA